MKIKQTRQAGFTLIEMIVSLGLFAVVVTIAVGSILVLIYTNQQLQKEQAVMTSLSFALDSMTREIRTGFNYYCAVESGYTSGGGPNSNEFNDSSDPSSSLGDAVANCPNGPYESSNFRDLHGISFYEGGDSLTSGTGDTRILYFYDAEAMTIKRRVGDGPAESIVPSGIEIVQMRIYVNGSETFTGGTQNPEQPSVKMIIQARDIQDAKIYNLQTTIVQRSLDL